MILWETKNCVSEWVSECTKTKPRIQCMYSYHQNESIKKSISIEAYTDCFCVCVCVCVCGWMDKLDWKSKSKNKWWIWWWWWFGCFVVVVMRMNEWMNDDYIHHWEELFIYCSRLLCWWAMMCQKICLQ